VYLSATHAVTLTPKVPFGLSKPVQLLIEGTPPSGLQDSFGQFIDGADNGRAGSNGVVVLRKTGVTLSELRRAGMREARALQAATVDVALDHV
jgi:hypothetical protein